MDDRVWDSLEVAKLVVGVLTPISVAILGVYIHRVTKCYEQSQWRSQKLIEKRLAIYDDLIPHFNDLMCYFTFVGCWKELDPPAVVAMKRLLDRKIFLAAPLFSESFFRACMAFQNACFEPFTGWGKDARLRTSFERRRAAFDSLWDHSWNSCYSHPSEVTDPSKIRQAYQEVMRAFADEIGIHESAAIPDAGRLPRGIQ